jgi:ribonuclease-3
LTHASADTDASNERLEFLGDRVLGLICAERLHALYPNDAEGALALKFNALARRETCAVAAEATGLAEHIILANAEAGSGGRHKAAILAGACEAVIAALYLDGGMEAARRFVDLYWTDAFAALGSDMRDPKTVLQEWAQARKGNKDAPVYKLVGRKGPDHAPRFEVQVSVAGEQPQTGLGGSKREAEQDAAKQMLVKLGLMA